MLLRGVPVKLENLQMYDLCLINLIISYKLAVHQPSVQEARGHGEHPWEIGMALHPQVTSHTVHRLPWWALQLQKINTALWL
nr:hypothetical protein BaRGS_033121 [Batillaria attramentaria]